MPISIAALRAMAAAGATPEMIIAAVEAEEVADVAAEAAKRKYERDRKRAYRLSLGHRGTTGDIGDETQAVAGPDVHDAQAAADALTVSSGQETTQKENPPHPLKKNTTSSLEDLFSKSISSEVARARSTPRATRLPDDWAPSLDDLAYARGLFPADQIPIECEKFRDHWHARAGPNAVKRSWPATWRTWCRRAVEFSRDNGNGSYRQNHHNGSGNGAGDPHAVLAVAAAKRAAAAFGKAG